MTEASCSISERGCICIIKLHGLESFECKARAENVSRKKAQRQPCSFKVPMETCLVGGVTVGNRREIEGQE